MKVIDVNVLIALFRPGHVDHGRALRWWALSQERGENFTVPDIVWVGFLRITTNRRVFATPDSFDAAWDFVESMRGDARYLSLGDDTAVTTAFKNLAIEASATGDLVTDAYIAAVAFSLGATVVTFDRDFRKFDGLRVLEPA